MIPSDQFVLGFPEYAAIASMCLTLLIAINWALVAPLFPAYRFYQLREGLDCATRNFGEHGALEEIGVLKGELIDLGIVLPEGKEKLDALSRLRALSKRWGGLSKAREITAKYRNSNNRGGKQK